MSQGDLLDEFASLFDGRRDAWGALHGECVRETLTESNWYEHLWGEGSIGIYPLREATLTVGGQGHLPAYVVRWGCVDIDTGFDMLPQAKNLHRAYRVLGITAWIEVTKSKGYHVWTFFREWTPAVTARKVGIVACQLAGVLPKEVNPKQVSLDGLKGYGNYVHLPYCKQFADQGKRVVIDEDAGQPIPLADFVWGAGNALATLAALDEAARLYVEPPKRDSVDIEEYNGQLDEITTNLSGLAWTIFTQGPLEGRDRSGTLARLAHLCRECELTATEAFAVAWDADGRWGKYHHRADGEDQVKRMIEAVFR